MFNLTVKRKKVYDTLKLSKKPLSVEEIFNNLNDSNINLSTIYRAIDYLESYNLLLKFHFDSKNYYFLNEDDLHKHYFVCTKCHQMHTINCQMENVLKTLENKHDFLITNHEMNVYGICNKCR